MGGVNMSEVSMEFMRNFLGETEESEAKKVEELRAKSPFSLLEVKVNENNSILDQRTQGMQDVDSFTLDKTFQLDDRTEGMKDIDNYSLDLIFQLLDRVDQLEQRILILEGGA